jgi:hypothetical protein
MILERDAFSTEYDASLTSLDDMYVAILDLAGVGVWGKGNEKLKRIQINIRRFGKIHQRHYKSR